MANRVSFILFATTVYLLVEWSFSTVVPSIADHVDIKAQTENNLPSVALDVHNAQQHISTIDLSTTAIDESTYEKNIHQKLMSLIADNLLHEGKLSLEHGINSLRVARSTTERSKRRKRKQKRRKRKSEASKKRDKRKQNKAGRKHESSPDVDMPTQQDVSTYELETMQQVVSAIAHHMQDAINTKLLPSKPQIETQQSGFARDQDEDQNTGTKDSVHNDYRFSSTATATETPKPSSEVTTSADDITLHNLKGDEEKRNGEKPRNTSHPQVPRRTEQRFVNYITRRKAPYYNVVRLSVGCTGTLITPLHVLTAAHCVHTGQDFQPNAHRIRIEVPSWSGFSLHRISKIHVPQGWIKSDRTRAVSDAVRAVYDYAVITMLTEADGRRQFPRFGIVRKSVISNPKFTGFPSDKGYQMLETKCPFDTQSDVILGGNLILSDCRASSGSSGSAVFVTIVDSDYLSSIKRHDNRRIVGLVSNSMLVNRYRQSGSTSRVTVINTITKRKRLTICAMMQGETRSSETRFHSVESCSDMADSSTPDRSTFRSLFVNRLHTH